MRAVRGGLLPFRAAMSDLDAIVIGGGPAGSTAGALLARAGRRVRIYDRERFPRFHVGESLLPQSEPLLRRLGVWEQLAAAGFQRKWGAHFTFEPDGGSNHISFAGALGRKPPAQAFQVRRAEFDHLLLKNAAAAGSRSAARASRCSPCASTASAPPASAFATPTAARRTSPRA